MSPDQLQSCDSLLVMNRLSCDCGFVTSATTNLSSDLTVGPPLSPQVNAPAGLQQCPNHAALRRLAQGNLVFSPCANQVTRYQRVPVHVSVHVHVPLAKGVESKF